MRHLLLMMVTALAVAVFPLSAQSSDDARAVVRDITEAMVRGNPNVLTKAAGRQLELTVDGQSSLYTREQARYVTGAFLDNHPLRDARIREVNVVGRQCTARSRLMGSDRSEAWDLYLRLRRTRKGWELKEVKLTPVAAGARSG
jgi:hypothetical protein